MTAYAHLAPNVLTIMGNPPCERIEHIRGDRWLPYSLAVAAVNKLEMLFAQTNKRRRVGLLLVGPTSNGKSMILEYFQKKHPGNNEPGSESAEKPVVMVLAPPKPDLGAFYNAVLTAVGAHFKASDTFSWKEIQVKSMLRMLKTRMIVIDELHHLASSRADHLVQFLNGIKNLSTALQVPIIGAGTKLALTVIRRDPQIENRIHPFPLPAWKDNREFRTLLHSIERILPLKRPSGLAEDKLAHKILHMCDGDKKSESYGATIGEIMDLLCEAGVKAIETEKEKIDDKILDQVSYKAPSKRQEHADRET